ncbi:uncharacterized protein LOC143149634 [Ptiloglossa arizonensis]|uniref:uncharacterized protein LOC143149634 n=1 Tax=Ptiloglossa arizonensis TaxID=3350558 RepID=UPI003FA13142
MQKMAHSEHLTATDRIVQEVLRAVKPTDVQFIVQDLIGRKCDIIDEIYISVSRTLPTSCISLNESIPAKLPSFRAHRSTLIFYVYVSRSSPDFQETENIIRVIVHDDTRPNVLLITILNENGNFQLLLEQMWQKRILYATILELSESHGQITATKIHRYNPFTNVYEQQPYTTSVEWFPNRVTNLHGYPVNVHLINRLGYMNVTWNSQGYLVTLEGPDAKVLKTISRALNFTFVAKPTKVLGKAFHLLSSGTVDMMVTSMPFLPSSNLSHLSYNLPVSFEKWCPVVPITRKQKNYVTQAFLGIAMNCIIVLVFWATSILLKFDLKEWKPLRIFGLIISASTPIKATRLVEKIVFFMIIFVSYISSSNLYVDVTSASLRVSSEIDYTNFNELYESGLVPVFKTVLINLTYTDDDEAFAKLKRKAIGINSLSKCIDYLAMYRNVTCLVETKMANMLLCTHTRRGEPIMKICKNLCYANPPAGYLFYKHSPYIDRVTNIILRMESAGIRKMWYIHRVGHIPPRMTHLLNIDNTNNHPIVFNLIYIMGCGYLISILTFFGEIIMYRLKTRKNILE